MMSLLRYAFAVAGCVLAGCAKKSPPPTASAPTAGQLTGTLSSPIDVTLQWTPRAAGAAGYIVEYINHPNDEWVILGFFPAGKNTFTHPRLAPGTPYSYRVRPFFGAVSNTVDVTIAEGLSDKAYADAYAQPEDYAWAPPRKITVAGDGVLARQSLRTSGATNAAAPAHLQAEIMKNTVSGFRLTWNDRSTDEEGFLLERVNGPGDFVVCALVEPDMNSFGWALEPPDRHAAFRVRAHYFGTPSNIVSFTTGQDPNDPERVATKKGS